MSNAAMWLVGLAAAGGIALAVSHANAAEAAPGPEPLPPETKPPVGPAPGPGTAGGSSGGPGGGGSGAPAPEPPQNIPDPTPGGVLPDILRNIDLSGLEVASFAGISNFDPGNHPFYTWIVSHSLNDMEMHIFVSVEHPDEWISAFWHPDPPGSTPDHHYIEFKVSDTPGKAWMERNILKMLGVIAPADFS